MTELNDLYQEVILDHSRNPRNRRPPDAPGLKADGHNPLCGDRLTVYVTLEGETITDICFEGSGCAISTAAASMMTEALRGKSLARAERLFGAFHDLVTGKETGHAAGDADGSAQLSLGKLEAFTGVREFPVRVKCATLAWHTMRAALENDQQPVTTE